MVKHSKILEKKFSIVDTYLQDVVSDIAEWNTPHGGYFITLKVPGFAKQIIKRCSDCGVILTEAGATHPYHKDKENAYIRLAPSYLEVDDLKLVMEILTTSIHIEYLSKENKNPAN